MKDLKNSLNTAYWQSFSLTEDDIEALYNSFMENELPSKIEPLIQFIIQKKLNKERQRLENMQSKSALYMPKETYKIGDMVEFSAFEMKPGKIINIRKGNNPDLPDFQVIEVEFEGGDVREFAAELEEHVLNEPILFDPNDPNLNYEYVLSNYENQIKTGFVKSLRESGGFVSIALEWFPESLLIDINEGHLNLAEAVLDFNDEEPISTTSICEQIGLAGENQSLLEFSFNIAMQADPRFDEVGPSGEVLWFLTAKEPKEVKDQPKHLILGVTAEVLAKAADENHEQISLFEGTIADEYEIRKHQTSSGKELTISLIYPHWRSGTLPLSEELRAFFPTAIEAPHIRFTFIDGHTNKKFPGWVVQPQKYICGLNAWYKSMELLPGSLIRIKKGEKAGEVVIRADKKHASRQWVRMAKMDANGKLSFSMDMSAIKNGYNDRMILAINDVEELDTLWIPSAGAHKFEQTVRYIMRELMKLNPQGHVHAQELYAATNLIIRTPPRAILNILNTAEWVSHQGDLYFRLEDDKVEEANSGG